MPKKKNFGFDPDENAEQAGEGITEEHDASRAGEQSELQDKRIDLMQLGDDETKGSFSDKVKGLFAGISAFFAERTQKPRQKQETLEDAWSQRGYRREEREPDSLEEIPSWPEDALEEDLADLEQTEARPEMMEQATERTTAATQKRSKKHNKKANRENTSPAIEPQEQPEPYELSAEDVFDVPMEQKPDEPWPVLDEQEQSAPQTLSTKQKVFLFFGLPVKENGYTAPEASAEFIKEQPKPPRKLPPFLKERDHRPNFIVGVFLTCVKVVFLVVVAVIVVGIGSVFGVASSYLNTAPELDTDRIEDQNLSSFIYDERDNLLAIYSGSENREMANLEDIPKSLQDAFIAVEDIRFYEHNGVDFRRLVGAFVSSMTAGTNDGGSTITQQLVKNKLLTKERSYKRKLQEAALSMELEKTYTKDEILEAYLNSIPLGGLVYGVKTAAYDYFGKELSDLNLREMVCIAAITQNPHQYNPRRATYGEGNLTGLVNRMNIVAERMLWNGMITQEQYDEVYVSPDEYEKPGYKAKWANEMNILEESPANTMYQYPHFVEYVIYDVQNFLMEKQGMEINDENRRLVDRQMRAGGYKITATIDTTMQEMVQQEIATWERYPRLKRSADNVLMMKDANGNEYELVQPQAAAVVLENDTGYLRAIIGSRNEPTTMRTFNRAYQGQMQVGSSIKPIGVYGPAFDIGYSLAAPIANIKAPITDWESEEGYPTTSTGTQGPTKLRDAIVNSLNISAARTLMDYVSIPTSVDYLHKFGVDDEHIDPTGVGLALGASPITPIQMVGAYSTFPRLGRYVTPVSFTKVVDAQGNVVLDSSRDRKDYEAVKPSTAWMITDALTQAVREGTGKNARIPNMTTAGKTGTVVDAKGTFFAGYTPYYTSALWVGHDKFKPFSGSTYASNSTAPLWKSYMTKIHETKGLADKPIIDKTPEELHIVKGTVCQYSGLKPNGSCPTFTDYMLDGTQPEASCNICSPGGRNFPEDSPYRQWGGGAGETDASGRSTDQSRWSEQDWSNYWLEQAGLA